MDLLRYYGNIEDDELPVLVEVESKILKCVAICLRSRLIIKQFLENEKKNKYFLYIMDLAREQLAIISDSNQNMLETFTKHDVSHLLNCLIIFRQLLLHSTPETKKCLPMIQKFSREVLEAILRNLN